MSFAEVLGAVERLGPVKKVGKEHRGLCPVHGDKSPSLEFHEADDASVVVQCRSQKCSFKAIAAALGLPESAFFPPRRPAADMPSKITPYSYIDEQGNELSQSVRKDLSNGKKTFYQRHRGPDGEWINNAEGVRLVLYGLPELRAANQGEPVWAVAGEKCVAIMRGHGFVATTNIGGEGHWTAEDSEFLRGRDVVVFPDADEVGHKHGQQVAAALQGIARSVRVVDVLGLPLKGDCEQYFSAGHTAEELRELAANTKEWTPQASTALAETAPEEPEDFALDTIEPRPIKGLWFGRLVNGEMTVITGAPGVGKGLLLCYVVAHYTTGRPMFGDRIAQPAGHVLWIAVEDAHDTSLVPRLIAARADRSRVHAWNMNRPLSLPEDVARIVARIDLHHAGIVIIDPAQTVINKDFSANADADVRRTFSPLAAACRARGCALVLVRHTNKRSLGSAMDRGAGSIAWSGMAAIEMMLGRRVIDGESTNADVNESVVTLATVKNNTGKWARSLNMRIVESGESARLEVIGETDSTADDLVAQDKPRTARKTEDAEALLRRVLGDFGWHLQKEIDEERSAAKISYSTLNRVKTELRIECKQRAKNVWEWRLPRQIAMPPGTENLSIRQCDLASGSDVDNLTTNNISSLESSDSQDVRFPLTGDDHLTNGGKTGPSAAGVLGNCTRVRPDSTVTPADVEVLQAHLAGLNGTAQATLDKLWIYWKAAPAPCVSEFLAGEKGRTHA